MLHPFREGNGRAQRIFFEQLALLLAIFWSGRTSRRSLDAMLIKAGACGDLAPQEAIFASVVSRDSL